MNREKSSLSLIHLQKKKVDVQTFKMENCLHICKHIYTGIIEQWGKEDNFAQNCYKAEGVGRGYEDLFYFQILKKQSSENDHKTKLVGVHRWENKFTLSEITYPCLSVQWNLG